MVEETQSRRRGLHLRFNSGQNGNQPADHHLKDEKHHHIRYDMPLIINDRIGLSMAVDAAEPAYFDTSAMVV